MNDARKETPGRLFREAVAPAGRHAATTGALGEGTTGEGAADEPGAGTGAAGATGVRKVVELLAGWGIKPADVVFAVGVVACAVALWAVLGVWMGGSAGEGAQDTRQVVIQNTEGFYKTAPLGRDARIVVESSMGTNVVEISGGMVRCVESDCKNQVCVNTGWVSEPGMLIVCLPHQLTVQVVQDVGDAVPLV